MAELDPARRAVITGLGAVMPIGNDFPTYWSNLLAGVTGTRTIRSFDASTQEVRIAAEVIDFDPTIAMDPKMARRMSRFIHFAMAAGKEAVADAGKGWPLIPALCLAVLHGRVHQTAIVFACGACNVSKMFRLLCHRELAKDLPDRPGTPGRSFVALASSLHSG